jgi:hypothetical protein
MYDVIFFALFPLFQTLKNLQDFLHILRKVAMLQVDLLKKS